MVAPKVMTDRLSDHFETRVRVDLGRTKGKIVIEFATVDDLERIVALIERQPDAANNIDKATFRAIQEEAAAGSAASA